MGTAGPGAFFGQPFGAALERLLPSNFFLA